MLDPYYFDTETCGFHGPMVLLQYALGEGDIYLHEPWHEPIIDTMLLIEEMSKHRGGIIGFNLAFDWFHMQREYTILEELLKRGHSPQTLPVEIIDEFALAESTARDGSCVKPVTALDLMLHARKGPYQTTMDRKDIRIRRVPKPLAYPLAKELERRIPLPDIYFAKRKNKTAPKWQVYTIKNVKTGKDDPDFVDVVMKFAPSSALKVLCMDAGIVEKDVRLLFSDVAVDEVYRPVEITWAPFATALSSKEENWECQKGKKKGYAWPGVIEKHIDHWRYDDLAREYAFADVSDTRGLNHHFGDPPLGDNDSILSCMVGASRWRGFTADMDMLFDLDRQEMAKIARAPKAPHHVYKYLNEVMSETELESLKDREGKVSTKRTILEEIEKWETDDESGNRVKHPAATRATEVLEARKGHNKHTLFHKIMQAGRLHASASVIGSLSSRMSGRTEVGDGRRASSINALGIQHDKFIRRCFRLAHKGQVLNGGDFDAFEVGIADARYDDPELRKQLTSCNECDYQHTPDEFREVSACPNCGCSYTACKNCKKQVVVTQPSDVKLRQMGMSDSITLQILNPAALIVKQCGCGNCEPYPNYEGTFRKIHALFAMELFPGNTYDDIIATKGSGDNDLYDKGKRGFFGGCLYGGDENTLEDRIGIPLEDGRKARERFFYKYKGIQNAQTDIFNNFCSMRQPGGIGTAVEWHEPAEKAVSLNGFPRFFSLENKICKALFTLAENPPKPWTQLRLKVIRRDRVQQAGGAVRSALFASAFAIQAASMRAATNHEIQSTGAIETKDLQCRIWKLQPSGIHDWHVQPFNVHDEVMAPSKPELSEPIEEIVDDFIEERKSLIPLLKMDWHSNMKNWAEKT